MSTPTPSTTPSARRRVVLAGTAVLVPAVLLTALVAVLVAGYEGERRESSLLGELRLSASAIEARAVRMTDAALAAAAVVATKPELTADQFEAVIGGQVLVRYARIQAVSFAAWVPADALAAYENAATARLGRSIEVHPAPAADADALVVEQIAPAAGNAAAVGLNLLSSPARAAAALEARNTGEPTATGPLQLVQDPDGPPGILLFAPVYKAGSNPSTGPERRRHFLGVASVIVQPNSMLGGVLGPSPTIDVAVYDVGSIDVSAAEEQPTLLYSSGDLALARANIAVDIVVGDRRWRVAGERAPGATRETPAAAIVALAGGIVALLLTVVAVQEVAARSRLQAQVAERTLELRRSNDALEAANELKSKFMGTISHELRTPLTVIGGTLDILHNAGDRLPVQTRNNLAERAHRNVTHLTGLIDELLDFNTLDVGARVLQRERTDVGELTASVVDGLTSLLDQHRVDVRVVPIQADVDRQALTRIVTNLVANAIKYTPPGSAITVTVRADGPDAEVTVSDNGPGIAPDDLPHVFERFYRGVVDGPRPKGTGIGLAVVAELATMHGGTATVDSEPGSGATFTIRLPRIVDEPVPRVEPARPTGASA